MGPEACFQRFDTGSEERATLSCGRKLPRNLGPLLSATAIPRTGVEANAGGPGSLHRALSSGCGCTVRVARLMRLAAKFFVFVGGSWKRFQDPSIGSCDDACPL